MSRLEIKTGHFDRVLKVKPIKVIGDINNAPIDKTYQNNGYRRMGDGSWRHIGCMLKLQIEEDGYITQRNHNLYKSSKKRILLYNL